MPLVPLSTTAPYRVPAILGVKITLTVQVWLAEYPVFAAQVPLPAFAKSNPAAPCVNTDRLPSVAAVLKVKVNVCGALWVPISSAAKFTPDVT